MEAGKREERSDISDVGAPPIEPVRALLRITRSESGPFLRPQYDGDFLYTPVDRQSSLMCQPDVFIRSFGFPGDAKHRITAVNQPARHRVEILRRNGICQ